MPLLVTGTIGIDTVHTPRDSREGLLGGSCAYFAAAASFFTPVRIVAAVGCDFPDALRASLESFENIDLAGLEDRPDSQTFAWGGRYFDDMNQRETLFTELGVLEENPPPIPDAYRDSEFIFLANTHPSAQLDFMRQFDKRRLVVADTMDLWINIAHDELIQLLGEIDGIVLNDSEAEHLTEERNAVTAARKILDMGPTFVIVKKGEHGAVLVHREGIGTMPAYPAEAHQVVDPTGAGDSFAGGLMGHITSCGSIDFATIQTGMAWATVAASFTIESFSLDRLASLTRGDIDDRMRFFQQCARIG